VVNGLVWLPWGIICLLAPTAWAGEVIPGLAVYDLSGPVARTEVRALYGGLQIAVGLIALIEAFKPKHRDTAFLFYVLALSGLVLSRIAGMVVEGDDRYLVFSTTVTPATYNQNGLAMYELPNFLFAWFLVLTRPRPTSTASAIRGVAHTFPVLPALMDSGSASGFLVATRAFRQRNLIRIPRVRLLGIRLAGRDRGEDMLEKPYAVRPLLRRQHRKRARDRRLPDGQRLGVYEHPDTLHDSQRFRDDVGLLKALLRHRIEDADE
jgi:Domain of unknown function (DUF4345)